MEVIRLLQATMPGPGWERFWTLVSKLSSEQVFVALVPILYWTADRRFTRLLAGLLLLSVWIGNVAKGLVGLPRPPALGIRVVPVDVGSPLGFPSGHAQSAALVWTVLASGVRRRWFAGLAAAAVLLVGVSRLYLGVHWPADVLGGWGLGLGLAWLGIRVHGRAGGWLSALPLWLRAALGAGIPVLLYAGYHAVPALGRVRPEDLPVAMGALAGFLPGTVLEEAWIGYRPHPRPGWQVVRVVLGIVLVFAARFGLKAVLPDTAGGDFVRYAAVALAATLLAPWLLRRIGGPVPSPVGAAERSPGA